MSLDTGATDLSSALTGTPTAAGTFVFTVRITNDISGAFDDQELTVTVQNPIFPGKENPIKEKNKITPGGGRSPSFY